MPQWRGDLIGEKSSLDFKAVIYIFLSYVFSSYQAPKSLGGHSGQFSLQLSHQGNGGFSFSMTKISRDRRTRWCPLSTIPGTSPHCLINKEENDNVLETSSLV